MRDVENLNFKIGVSGVYWNKRPDYTIGVDGREYARGTISNPSGVIEYIEFTVIEVAPGPHILEVTLLNKDQSDTVQNSDKTVIVNDMLLNIDSIEVNSVSVGHLRHSASVYKPTNAQLYEGSLITELRGCVTLGWNGVYAMSFQSPFYMWVLTTSLVPTN